MKMNAWPKIIQRKHAILNINFLDNNVVYSCLCQYTHMLLEYVIEYED